MSNLENTLDKAINWATVALAFLLPLFFLPVTVNFYELPKNLLLIGFAGLLVLAWIGKMVTTKRVTFLRTPLDLPVGLLALVFILSSLFASPNRFTSFTSPGATGTVLALSAIFFVLTNNFKVENLKLLASAIILSASLAAALAIFQFIGVASLVTKTDWLAAKTFTPLGGLLVLSLFLLVSLPLVLQKVTQKKGPSLAGSIFPSLAAFLTASGLGTTVYQLVTSAKPILLDYKTGWAIAIETLKSAPLLGVGPANFLSAFTRFKPMAANASQFWGLRFNSSSNWYFQLLTTVGILGIACLIFLLWRVRKLVQNLRRQEKIVFAFGVSLVFGLLALVFLPINLLSLFFLYLFLAVMTLAEEKGRYREESQILPYLFLVIAVGVVISSFYFMGRVFAADYYFKRSLDALAANRGAETYNLQIRAISLNPASDTYRASYSQTNLALANAIASSPDLTDQDRQQISILIQQAIREAKAAVAVNPQSAPNWENLATIYRSLMNLAQGAEDWTIASYQTAVSLDPANPVLRVSLGGVYYALKNWDQAIRQFEIATTLKPNFANAHYNLAAALREKGELARAASELEIVLALVPADSGDWQKASGELEELRKKLGEAEEKVKTPESLTPPQVLPSPLEPPIKLPEEAAPPEALVTPTPEPTVTPTPTPAG